jgi:hypothetical protein
MQLTWPATVAEICESGQSPINVFLNFKNALHQIWILPCGILTQSHFLIMCLYQAPIESRVFTSVKSKARPIVPKFQSIQCREPRDHQSTQLWVNDILNIFSFDKTLGCTSQINQHIYIVKPYWSKQNRKYSHNGPLNIALKLLSIIWNNRGAFLEFRIALLLSHFRHLKWLSLIIIELFASIPDLLLFMWSYTSCCRILLGQLNH